MLWYCCFDAEIANHITNPTLKTANRPFKLNGHVCARVHESRELRTRDYIHVDIHSGPYMYVKGAGGTYMYARICDL